MFKKSSALDDESDSKYIVQAGLSFNTDKKEKSSDFFPSLNSASLFRLFQRKIEGKNSEAMACSVEKSQQRDGFTKN